jgi:hypothetical protein
VNGLLVPLIPGPPVDLRRFQVNRPRGIKAAKVIDRYRPPADEGEHMSQVFGDLARLDAGESI